jgi:predicted NAD-dependent protein-ADP-ribosyltransferase YbiA (DUF1768 family)
MRAAQDENRPARILQGQRGHRPMDNSGALSMSTPLPTPTPQQIGIGNDPYRLVAFYFPGSNTGWDDIYNAPFLGNFWPVVLSITVAGKTATFHTAEAAFQSTKWWDKSDASGRQIRPQFEACLNGKAAFHLSKRLSGDPRHGIPAEVAPDLNYAGLGRDGAMLVALKAKFSDPALQAGLLATADAYLLEHNEQPRDDYWSDNHDGSGSNMLGKTLMSIRGSLPGGHGEPKPSQLVLDFTRHVMGNSSA